MKSVRASILFTDEDDPAEALLRVFTRFYLARRASNALRERPMSWDIGVVEEYEWWPLKGPWWPKWESSHRPLLQIAEKLKNECGWTIIIEKI